jgi:uncharacterized protein (DUF1501 family)
LLPTTREGIVVASRRGMLKAGVAGMAGLSLPGLLKARARAAGVGGPSLSPKSLILLWMTGGPSHIDTWDPKPDAPREIRGPFGTIATSLPGVPIGEHMPRHAAAMHKFTLVRSVDAAASNHEPNMVFQTGNLTAEPRVNREAERYPAIASAVAQRRGANQPGMPPYVALNVQSRSHLAWGGYLGKQFDPIQPEGLARDLALAGSLSLGRLHERRGLLADFDRLRRDLDQSGSMAALDDYGRQAVEMVAGNRAREAFDLSLEPASSRERYGDHAWAQQALLARRLVAAGVAFVTIDLSHHSASGTWDTHGDDIPPYGGIESGLKPLLPPFDHLLTTLVDDLDERGLLDQTLVIAMGDFGRTPKIGIGGGRDHWQPVASMAMAGGGLRHGQVLGSSDRQGGAIASRPVRPGDLAATIYRHFGVPLDATYTDHQGRPRYLVEHGEPIQELL